MPGSSSTNGSTDTTASSSQESNLGRQLFVANLPLSMGLASIEERLASLFRPFGNLVQVKARRDGSGLPIAFVHFREPIDLRRVCGEEVTLCVDGRRLRIEPTRIRSRTTGRSVRRIAVEGEDRGGFKVLLGGLNLELLSYRHILTQTAAYGHVLDLYVYNQGDEEFGLPPNSALIVYREEAGASRVCMGLNDMLWAGWRIQVTPTDLSPPELYPSILPSGVTGDTDTEDVIYLPNSCA